MEEATEICKLRLFLKLVSQVKQLNHIEPLPDIDFNIRAGNTLVGFASIDEVKQAVSKDMRSLLTSEETIQRIEQKTRDVERDFDTFRRLQTQLKVDPEEMAVIKKQVSVRLHTLDAELDRYLASEYGIDQSNITDPKAYQQKFAQWQHNHQPFHWFVKFYGIINKGGFDVIIGNPPYLELREISYQPLNFKCNECSAVHAICIERSLQLLDKAGCISMIVPLALVSTQRMKIVQQLLELHRAVWYSNFSWRPGKLFENVNRALTIFVATPSIQEIAFSTNYQKWTSNNRDTLMLKIDYVNVPDRRPAVWVPKIGYQIEYSILEKCLSFKTVLNKFITKSNSRVYYRTTGGLYWKVFTDFPPAFKVNGTAGHSTRETWLSLTNVQIVKPIVATLSSDIFWWWYTVTSNCRDLNPYDIQNFPIPQSALNDLKLIKLGEQYLEDMQKNSIMQPRIQKQTGQTETQSFKLQKSKPIIDEIDRILAQHYGFTDEELDFIINYDIKYRMGRDSDEG